MAFVFLGFYQFVKSFVAFLGLDFLNKRFLAESYGKYDFVLLDILPKICSRKLRQFFAENIN
jgi:hypothetical protein